MVTLDNLAISVSEIRDFPSILSTLPLISWCCVKYPLLFNSVSVIYSVGIEVKYPLSLTSWDVFVGILGLLVNEL